MNSTEILNPEMKKFSEEEVFRLLQLMERINRETQKQLITYSPEAASELLTPLLTTRISTTSLPRN